MEEKKSSTRLEKYNELINNVEGAELPHVVFKVGDNKYAISSKYVLHLEVLKDITPMVGQEWYARGVILFDDKAIPVFDIRKLFGIKAQSEDLEEFMQERISNHDNWVAELEASVEEERDFTLATDPRDCPFGQWLYNLETENNYFEMYIKNVEEPHREVHQTAVKVKSLMAQGKKEEARAAIAKMKETSLAQTKKILAQAAKAFVEGENEMIIVMQLGDSVKGIVVDSIENVKVLNDISRTPPNMDAYKSEYVTSIAKDTLPNGEIDLIFMFNTKML